MNIICTILNVVHHLVERVSSWVKKSKISKKSRREKAVFVAGSIAVAAVAFCFHGVNAQGKNQVYALEHDEESGEEEQEPENDIVYGLDSIIQSVLISQDTQSKILKVGTSFEVVLVGQRIADRAIESRFDFTSEGVNDVEMLKGKTVGISEGRLAISDKDYQNLLKIVEAEAGGEDLKGKILVANVIFNRVESSEFPDNVTDVVWQNAGGSAQFSPTIDGRINKVKVSDETRKAVNRAIDGVDYSKGAMYFVEEGYADKDNVAWFKEQLTFLFRHGAHDFYR